MTFVFVSVAVFALSADDIEFPVQELGGCASEFECGVYCGDPAHVAECDAFIEEYNLDDRAEKLKNIEFPIEELGGCESRSACESFCEQPNNYEACLDFAEENDLLDEHEVDDIEFEKKMARLVAEGKTPGGCTNEDTCIEYCMIDGNFNECLIFLEENDIIPDDELEMIKERGSFDFDGPGGCGDEESCKEYCSLDENFNECLVFIEEEGFLPDEEIAMLKEVGSFRGPGGCLMDECENFCEDQDNFEVCIEFAHDHGLIPDDEYEMVKKTGGVGPGGCQGRECEDFCENPDNGEVCFEFACEHGFIGEEECERGVMSFGAGPGGCQGPDECESYCSQPENGPECFQFSCDNGFATQEECDRGIGFIHEEFAGPGGCQGENECEAYCDNPDNNEECFNFACDQGFMGADECSTGFIPPFEGPGGCMGEECDAYCQDKPEECSEFYGQFEEHPEGQFEEDFYNEGEFIPFDEHSEEFIPEEFVSEFVEGIGIDGQHPEEFEIVDQFPEEEFIEEEIHEEQPETQPEPETESEPEPEPTQEDTVSEEPEAQ